MKRLLKSGLCLLISMLMVITAIPAQAFAAADGETSVDGSEKPTKIINADGEREVNAEWVKEYPYGVFAFSNYAATATEGDGEVTIPIYRLGGTQGRVTAYVFYNPNVTMLDKDKYGYLSALSTDDFELEMQDASPIAQYQPVGKAPDPEAGSYTVKYADQTISLSNDADKYQWQVKGESNWDDVFEETNKTLTVTEEDYDSFDFRCVYTKGDKSYCTASVKGEKYVKPEPEVLPEMPKDLDIGQALTYTKLEPDKDDAFKAYVFPVTFADGEWVKNLRFTPIDDDISECPEASSLIIQECEGGCINKNFNSTTFTVMDNEPAEPFELGFAQTKITADKADGKANIVVRRTGGFQEPVTIDYETVDGTAIAGKDYVAASSTMGFVGDIMEITLELPLLDDGITTDKPKEFTVRLKNLQVDANDLCTLTNTEVTVSLINSGTAKKMNLNTKLTDTDAINLASTDDLSKEGAVDTQLPDVTGTQVQAAQPAYAKIKKGKTVRGMLKSYQYPDTIDFRKTEGVSYWGDVFIPYYDQYPPADFGSSSGATGGGVFCDWGAGYWSGYEYVDTYISDVLSTRNDTFCAYQYDYLSQKYSSFSMTLREKWGISGSTTMKVESGIGSTSQITNHNPHYYEYEENGGGVNYFNAQINPNLVLYEYERLDHNDDSSDYFEQINAELDVTENYNSIIARYFSNDGQDLPLVEDYWKGGVFATQEINDLSFTRRVFNNPIGITFHTANDPDTAPEGALNLSDSVYDSMEPQISLVENLSGINDSGQLYVGSKLQIDLRGTQAFSAINKKDQSAAIYLAGSDGKPIVYGEKSKTDDGVYTITLVWQDMTEDAMDDNYTINIVMNREQDIALDFTASVPRLTGTDKPDPNEYGNTYNAFWENHDETATNAEDSYIEYAYSEKTEDIPYYDREKITVVKLKKADISYDETGAVISPVVEDNVQWVNFHRRASDYILVGGSTYAGDERIWLNQEELNMEQILYRYYSAEYADVATCMITTVDHIELYKDTNHNNMIDGTFDEYGFFHLNNSSGDVLLTQLKPDDTFTEEDIDYILEEDGKFSQLYLKVYYTMNPRKLKATDEEKEERAQVMPALVTDITDPAEYFALTDEQKNYRYLISGQNADGTYTSDGHMMYGGEASLLQFVDLPLGGDQSPPESHIKDSDGTIYYTWEPHYQGNLLFPYDDPAPIYLKECVVEENYALTDKDVINGYLGSLTANTTPALCVFQQKKTVGEILAARGSKSRASNDDDDDNEYSFENPDSSTTTDTVPMPDPKGWTDGETGSNYNYTQSAALTPGMQMSYESTVPYMKIGVLGFVTIVRNRNDVIVSVNVPIPDSNSVTGEIDSQGYTKGGFEGDTQSQLDTFSDLLFDRQKLIDTLKRGGRASSASSAVLFFGVKAYVTIGFQFQWKYDVVKKQKLFQQMVFGAVAGLEGSITWRPALFFYVCFTGGVNISTGCDMIREQSYDYSALYTPTDTENGTKLEKDKTLQNPDTQKYSFPVKYRELNIGFKGKINIDLYSDENCKTPVKKANRGYLETKTERELHVPLMSGSGSEFDDGKTYYVQITALEDSVIDKIQMVTDTKVDCYPIEAYLNVTPYASIAIGLGVSFLKIEFAGHFSYSMTFIGSKDETALKQGILSFGLSINIQLIIFSFSFDIVTWTDTYDYPSQSWVGMKKRVAGQSSNALPAKNRGKTDYGSLFSLPGDTSDTQTIYQPGGGGSSGMLKAYAPTDKKVPFELSGYYSSSNAAKLLDGVSFGYDYRVVTAKKTVGGETKDVNYVVYHISRDDAQSSVDQSMLVLSELTMEDGNVGMVNPADPSSETPYIVVDANETDATGDLGFNVDTYDNGSKLRVAWVSFDKASQAGAAVSTDMLSETAKNTVIKTSTYTPGSASFSSCSVISNSGDANAAGAKGEYVQLPDLSEDAVVYVRSNHISKDELDQRTELYEDFLKNNGYCVDNPTSSDEIASHSMAVSQTATMVGMWATSGKSSDLCVKIGDAAVSSVPMEDGVTITDAEIEKINGKYYVAYTTMEDCYTDKQGNITGDTNEFVNKLNIKRLYLRTCTLGKDKDNKDIVEWGMDGKAILLRTLYDYENNDDTLQDGIFSNGEIMRKDNPYFDNIQFLTANLGSSLGSGAESETLPLRGSSSNEDFLVFDMCGSTYVIRQSSLEAMTGSGISTDDNGLTTTSAAIIPFFTPDTTNSENDAASLSSGRVNTTIGVDGDGNLAAVYITSMPDTENTALCVSTYDPDLGCWGTKTVLAMNYLSVYEDNLKHSRDDADSRNAFLGLLEEDDTDGKNEEAVQGGLNTFAFKNPQIALGKESVVQNGKVVSKPTLMILTQGSMKYLKENTDPATKAVLPYIEATDEEVQADPDKYDRSKDCPSGTGIYAIEFGTGTQAVGNVSFTIPVEDFSSGAQPNISASFENTGDVPIRGSKEQPISVEIITSKDHTVLGEWEVTENILPGQSVSFAGSLDIKTTLKAGTKLYLKVEENDYYKDQGGTPFSAISKELLRIKESTELAVREYNDNSVLTFDTVKDDGDTIIDIDFIADNRGTSDAEGVYAVISYDTGETDEDGNAVYAPIDLTKADISVEDPDIIDNILSDKKNGEISIGEIKIGYRERISGQLKVSPDLFKERLTNTLTVKIELFSDADKQLPEDTPAGVHNEYNSANNIYTAPVKHQTVFTAPANIEIPAGEELHIPVKCIYTMGNETPHILVTEFPDLEGNTNFGAHAFRYGAFSNGKGSGTIQLKAETEGSGFIRIKDVSTNCYFDIAYTVTPSSSGENIYYMENSIFTFYKPDMTPYDPSKEDDSWLFQNEIINWGIDQSQPYEKDLARGKEGSSFTFDTDAESIDLVFAGTAYVELINDDGTPVDSFKGVRISAGGGSGDKDTEYATVDLGNNPKGLIRTVRVTVVYDPGNPYVETGHAYFDRVIQHYNQSALPVPDTDENAPQIHFSRSFPAPGSIAAETSDGKKNSVTIDTYVFDETGIASVSVNGKVVDIKDKEDVRFWTASIAFGNNGLYTITTIDDLGNMADYKVNIDWFSTTAENESSPVPEVEAKLMKRGETADEDVELTDDVDFTEDDSAYIEVSGTASDGGAAKPAFTVKQFTVTQKDGLISRDIGEVKDGEVPAMSGGWYIVKAVDPASNGDCWNTAVADMMRLSKRQIILDVDNKEKFEMYYDPEFTYTATGLWDGDEITGSLSREPGEGVGVYPITLGSLSAGDDYHFVYKNQAYLTIRHEYRSQPTWDWNEPQWEEVELDMSAGNVYDIHPDHYTLNDGKPVSMDASSTRYVMTGDYNHNTDYCKIRIHDGETASAYYHFCMDNFTVSDYQSEGFFIVGGDNASIELLMRGPHDYVYVVGDNIFVSESTVSTVTPVDIGVEGLCAVGLFTYDTLVSDEMFTFNFLDDYNNSSYYDAETGIYKSIHLIGDEDKTDPYESAIAVSASFICAHCGRTDHAYALATVDEEVPATCTDNAVLVYRPTVAFDGRDFTDEIRKEVPDSALGHDYSEVTWDWSTDDYPEVKPGLDHWFFEPYKYYHGSIYQQINYSNDFQKANNFMIVLSGEYQDDSYDFTLSFEGNDGAPMTYNVCLDGVNITQNKDFIRVNGENVIVNLLLRGENSITCNNGHIFAITENAGSNTTIRIGTDGDSSTDFVTNNSTIAADNVVLLKSGDFLLDSIDSLDEMHEKDQCTISGNEGDPNPLEKRQIASATFTCSRCQDQVVVEAEVNDEGTDGKPHRVASVNFEDNTYTNVCPEDRFLGHSLSLDGSIGVNFFVDLSEDEVNSGATVDFAWTVNGKEKTSSVMLTKQDKTDNGYRATCPVAVAEMTYDVTATLSIKGVVEATDTYSAVQYADTILTNDVFGSEYVAEENDNGNNGEEKLSQLRTLVKAMLDFGAKAQIAFDRDKENLANQKLTSEDADSPYYYAPAAVTPDMIDTGASDMSAGLDDFGLEYFGSTIVYLSGTSIRHYYKITDQDKFDAVKDSVTFDGSPVTFTQKNGSIYYELKSIHASELDTLYTLSIGGTEYKYSALEYVKACLNSEKVSEATKALVSATYLYNQAANTFFGS